MPSQQLSLGQYSEASFVAVMEDLRWEEDVAANATRADLVGQPLGVDRVIHAGSASVATEVRAGCMLSVYMPTHQGELRIAYCSSGSSSGASACCRGETACSGHRRAYGSPSEHISACRTLAKRIGPTYWLEGRDAARLVRDIVDQDTALSLGAVAVVELESVAPKTSVSHLDSSKNIYLYRHVLNVHIWVVTYAWLPCGTRL